MAEEGVQEREKILIAISETNILQAMGTIQSNKIAKIIH